MTTANAGMFWPGRSVVVTGGGGFLGSAVVDELRRRGANDIAVPRSKDYDLRRRDAVERLFDERKPRVVLNIAATAGGIGANSARPGSFFFDNAMLGIQTMECARVAGVEKFVQIGTVCSYPKITNVPFKEDDLWLGYPEETNAPYGLAKKMTLVQGQAYRKQYGFNSIHLLLTNLYGPRDNFDPESSHVVPAMILKFIRAMEANAAEVTLWGTGRPTRDLLYVGDAAEAIVSAAERYDAAEPVNVGSGREVAIRELAETVARLVGFRGRLAWDATRPDGQPRRCLDASRARAAFGFSARTSLEQGLEETLRWYRSVRGPAR